MKTINLIIGFLALVLLLVILPGTAVGLISVWGLLACIAGFVLCVVLVRYFRKGNSSKPNPDVTEDERAW
jgi:peptidoglycan/LPS O-acetylase OafA/YrhL